jgi:hypothetical protein
MSVQRSSAKKKKKGNKTTGNKLPSYHKIRTTGRETLSTRNEEQEKLQGNR